MQRTVAVIVAFLLCMGLASCGGEGASDSQDLANEGQTASEQPASTEEEPSEALERVSEEQMPASQSAEQHDPALAARLTQSMQEVIDGTSMQVNTYVIDLKTGTTATCAGDQQVASASMIKLIIAETVLTKAEQDDFSIDDTYVLQTGDIVGGTGSLQASAGVTISYRELVTRMLRDSDNTAANVLIDLVGMDAVNERAHELGLVCTQLNRKMMDMDAIAQGVENYTSAHDLAVLLEMVYHGTFVSADASTLVLEALEQQSDATGICNGLPAGIVFAHKTGTLSNVRHDGGIAEGETPFVLVVLCSGDGYSEYAALQTMAQVGSAVYATLA